MMTKENEPANMGTKSSYEVIPKNGEDPLYNVDPISTQMMKSVIHLAATNRSRQTTAISCNEFALTIYTDRRPMTTGKMEADFTVIAKVPKSRRGSAAHGGLTLQAAMVVEYSAKVDRNPAPNTEAQATVTVENYGELQQKIDDFTENVLTLIRSHMK